MPKTSQLTSFDIQLLKLEEKQRNCKHKFRQVSYIPSYYDDMDEVFEVAVCGRCGYKLER